MNEYVITFKYDGEYYTRQIQAENKPDALEIAYERTRGMLPKFDTKDIEDLEVTRKHGKKERTVSSMFAAIARTAPAQDALVVPPMQWAELNRDLPPAPAVDAVRLEAQQRLRQVPDRPVYWYQTPQTALNGQALMERLVTQAPSEWTIQRMDTATPYVAPEVRGTEAAQEVPF